MGLFQQASGHKRIGGINVCCHSLKLVCLSLALLLLSASVLPAQDKVLKKFHWGVTSLSASQWIPWIAKEAKLYEKYGMEADLVLLRGSGQSAQAIIGGSILGAPCTLTIMGANLSGADLVRWRTW